MSSKVSADPEDHMPDPKVRDAASKPALPGSLHIVWSGPASISGVKVMVNTTSSETMGQSSIELVTVQVNVYSSDANISTDVVKLVGKLITAFPFDGETVQSPVSPICSAFASSERWLVHKDPPVELMVAFGGLIHFGSSSMYLQLENSEVLAQEFVFSVAVAAICPPNAIAGL